MVGFVYKNRKCKPDCKHKNSDSIDEIAGFCYKTHDRQGGAFTGNITKKEPTARESGWLFGYDAGNVLEIDAIENIRQRDT